MTIVCGVCELGKSKYKCPECLISYCSLDCWKTHKSSTTCKPVAYKENPKRINLVHSGSQENTEFLSGDAVPLEKLQAIGQSKELREVLKNHHLRQMLKAIDKSHHPAQAVQAAMVEQSFVQFADTCLKIVESSTE